MPNLPTPRTEGERMDMAEIMVERAREIVEYRLTHHPLRVVQLAAKWQDIAVLADYWKRQAARPEATITDKNNNERYGAALQKINEALDVMFKTEIGREVFAMTVDEIAGETRVVGS